MRFSPGDLDHPLPPVDPSEAEPALAQAAAATRAWAKLPLKERIAHLVAARSSIETERQSLARGIALETGKPIREAEGELGAVLGKFDLSFHDAREHLATKQVTDGPHPGSVRRLARGVAVVIAPFNFPLHLGHGAAVAHLLAGNPVIFKPSPFAGHVAGFYSQLMQKHLPPGVFQCVQGGAETAKTLCLDQRTRSICFTGSVAAGRELSRLLADQFDKELALELGGKNPALIFPDADLPAAAQAVADGLCLTCGQRCNATSRLLLQRDIAEEFTEHLLAALHIYSPGDPLQAETRLGPLISEMSVARYLRTISEPDVEWILEGSYPGEVGAVRGHYVTPAVARLTPENAALFKSELFAPILGVELFENEETALELANNSEFGLTASVFTRSRERFERVCDDLRFANLYANLPTTFSPSTLPFGGLGFSSNRRPGGRGFIRFTTDEQAMQWAF